MDLERKRRLSSSAYWDYGSCDRGISLAATWALFALTENAEIQTRLRTELLTVDSDNPAMDKLDVLPYLDCVVRETLHADPPVPAFCA
jgi:cytochrome P450